MKKILLVCFTVSIFYAANAQVEKGSIFTGGSVGFNTSQNENVNNPGKSTGLSWSLSPQFGKAFKQNKIIGIQLQYNGSINKIEPAQNLESKNTSSSFGVGVFYREYFPIYQKWFFYGQGTLGVNVSKNEQKNQGITTSVGNGWNTGIDGSLGISYQAGRKCWLEAGLNSFFNIGYYHSKSEAYQAGQVTTATKGNGLSASFNASSFNNIAIGFRWIIPAKA